MAEGKRLLPVEDGRQQFAFAVVQLLEKEPLGSGSYGTVYKAKCDEIICAAKKLYPALFQVDPIEPGREHTHPLRRFEAECYLLKNIDHPNIIQYLGTYRDPDTNAPVLLMELMDESLTHFLESSPGDIPYHIQVNLSYDIAQALAFLHANDIVHRDLSSNNVLLLAGIRAKITDFGMSKLIDTRSAQMTKCPGTPVFMPPEALDDSPVYTKKIDNFSFGVLIVQMLTRKFPEPSNRFKVINVINPTDPTLSVRAQVPEVKRREAHISLIDQAHPLLPVALDCLKDHDTNRPTSQELCRTFHSIKLTPDYQGSVQQSKDQTMHMNNIIKKISEEMNNLTQENEARTRQLRELNKQLQINEQAIAQQQQEIGRKNREISLLQQMTNQQHTEVSTQQVDNSEPTTEEEVTLTLDGSIDIPDTIAHCSPAVIGDMVYIKSAKQNVLLEYDTNKEKWSVIKNHPILLGRFSIVNINDVLTTVGGDGISAYSNKLYCYKLKTWVEIFPPMPFRHRCPAVVCTQNHLVVIGNDKGALKFEKIQVSVMNTETHEWLKMSHNMFDSYTPEVLLLSPNAWTKPNPWKPNYAWTNDRLLQQYFNTSAVVCQDRLYVNIRTGKDRVCAYIYSLSDLIKKRQVKHESFLKNYSYISNIGGVCEWYEKTKLIFGMFKTKKVVGEMSVARSEWEATILPHNKVMFIGFENDDKCSADIFTISRM